MPRAKSFSHATPPRPFFPYVREEEGAKRFHKLLIRISSMHETVGDETAFETALKHDAGRERENFSVGIRTTAVAVVAAPQCKALAVKIVRRGIDCGQNPSADLHMQLCQVDEFLYRTACHCHDIVWVVLVFVFPKALANRKGTQVLSHVFKVFGRHCRRSLFGRASKGRCRRHVLAPALAPSALCLSIGCPVVVFLRGTLAEKHVKGILRWARWIVVSSISGREFALVRAVKTMSVNPMVPSSSPIVLVAAPFRPIQCAESFSSFFLCAVLLRLKNHRRILSGKPRGHHR